MSGSNRNQSATLCDDVLYLLEHAIFKEYLTWNEISIIGESFTKEDLKNFKSTPLYLRERTKNKQNVWHLFLSWEDKKYLNKYEDKLCHVLLRTPLREKLKKSNGEKDKFSQEEMQEVFASCIKENVPFYFKSLKEYYFDQLKNITDILIDIFTDHKDLFTTMLLERDDNGFTPLYYIGGLGQRLNTLLVFIKTLPERDKHRILFAKTNNNRLFLHELCYKYHVIPEKLIDVFGEANIALAMIQADINLVTPFHLVCSMQKRDKIHTFYSLLHRQFPSVMFMQDIKLETPLHCFIRNSEFNATEQDIFNLLSTNLTEFNQCLQMQMSTGNTLLLQAIVFNQHEFLKVIPKYAEPTALFYALLQKNNGDSAIKLAIQKGDLDTLQYVIQLYSPWPAAFCGIFTTTHLDYNQAEKLSASDIESCIHTLMGKDFTELAAVIRQLIFPLSTEHNADFIKDVVTSCVYIAQGNRLPLPASHSTFSFFTPKRFPDLESRLKNVTAETIQWYFAEVLPFLSNYVTNPDEKKWVDMIYKQCSEKITSLNSIQSDINTTYSMASPPILQPVYDARLERKWLDCNDRIQAMTEQAKIIANNLSFLNQWATDLHQREDQLKSVNVKIYNPQPFNIKATNKTDFDPYPPGADALEKRRIDCRRLESEISEIEKALAKQQEESKQWEANLHQREQDLEKFESGKIKMRFS